MNRHRISLKAYRLESEFAVYPRVVIDPLVFEEF
jgi:hypothetical protein